MNNNQTYYGSEILNLWYLSSQNSDYKADNYNELTNHLGNVLSIVSDRVLYKQGDDYDPYNKYNDSKNQCSVLSDKISIYPDVLDYNDYYPFGSTFEDASKTALAKDYRYGFNGMEKDDDVKGKDNQIDYGFRVYNPRIGRFLNVDPLSSKYAMLAPYQFASNTPIQAIDVDGLEASVSTTLRSDGTALIKITIDIEIVDNSCQSGTIQNTNNEGVKSQTSSTYTGTDAKGNTYITEVNYKASATLKLEYTEQVVDKNTGIAKRKGTIGNTGDGAGNGIGGTQVNNIQVLAGDEADAIGLTSQDIFKTGAHELGHVLGLRHPYRSPIAPTATTPGVMERGDPLSKETETGSPSNIMMQSSVSRYGVTAKMRQLKRIVTEISGDVGNYGVIKGDTLYGISKRFGISIKKLQSLNSDIKDINKIKVGQNIKLK